MSEIYEKRGTWYLKEEGKDIKTFSSEQDAKESLGYKEPIEKNVVNAKIVNAILVSVKMMNKAEILSRDKIAADFTAKWEYRLDKKQYGSADAWVVIRKEDEKGKLVGDCEDYALSILWRLCGKSDWKMWWMLLTRQAGICCVGPSKWKVSHAVLRYKGDYIDNWTKKFGPKSEIEKNHTFHVAYGHGLFHFTVIKMLMSKVVRIFKKR